MVTLRSVSASPLLRNPVFSKFFGAFAVLFALASSLADAQPVQIYAAGSLRAALQDLKAGYAAEAPFDAAFTFGPSGKLRERIEAGDAPALFASASPTHTERLVKAGKLRSHTLFARNSLCVLAREGVSLQSASVVETLLSPTIRVGTSTPGADPSGDYTWEMFKKVDRLRRPGAFDVLDKKALKLTGAEINTTDSSPQYASVLRDNKADVFVTYCTNAALAMKEVSSLTFATVPADIDVASDYSIGIAMDAPESARLFTRYIMSARGQAILARYGFSKVPQSCDDNSPRLSAALAAWKAPAARLAASGLAKTDVPISVGSRTEIALISGEAMQFARRDEGKRKGSWGGSAAFTVRANGQYEIFLDQRGWIDVALADTGEVLPSIRSDRWLGCAGVNKNLGFLLKSGVRYQLQLSEIEKPTLNVLIAPIPAAPN
jgi:molybdate transport system substrate-binding protein